VYKEKNNKSYVRNKEWANEVVGQLLVMGIVDEVKEEVSRFVNPLTVAGNTVGQRRLCIGLSRSYNGLWVSPKFKVRFLNEFANLVEKGDNGFNFGLRSFYLQITVHKDFHKFLGFCIQQGDWAQRFLPFRMLPFGLNNAARVVTKIMKFPL
jgi:hypothetical protein